jgi:ParB family chromosome partitioning protein
MPNIKVNLIEISKNNIRKAIVREDLDSLAKNIASIGLINPISVIERDGRYELIAGQRRFLAIKKLGWEEIEAKILPDNTTDTKAIIYSVSENLQHKPPRYEDYVEAANKLFDAFGGSPKKVAEELNISYSRALNLLKRRLVPKEVAKLVDEKKMSWEKAQQLAEAAWPDEKKIIELANEIIKMPSTRQKRVIRSTKKTPKSDKDTIIKNADKMKDNVRLRNIEISQDVYKAVEDYAKKRDLEIGNIIEEAIRTWLKNRG